MISEHWKSCLSYKIGINLKKNQFAVDKNAIPLLISLVFAQSCCFYAFLNLSCVFITFETVTMIVLSRAEIFSWFFFTDSNTRIHLTPWIKNSHVSMPIIVPALLSFMADRVKIIWFRFSLWEIDYLDKVVF